ncbi:MAG TPA: DUF2442 domain-containing protein [Desulfotomaculum sp.]|nr:DUF2442 domain-containing protein [Desulfotomaculum sp.]
MQSPDIMKAKVLNDHKIMLIFKNGEQKIFDMKPYLNYPVFKPLEDQAEFNQFEIVDGTVEWKCGADLSQDTFYLESVSASEINAMG